MIRPEPPYTERLFCIGGSFSLLLQIDKSLKEAKIKVTERVFVSRYGRHYTIVNNYV